MHSSHLIKEAERYGDFKKQNSGSIHMAFLRGPAWSGLSLSLNFILSCFFWNSTSTRHTGFLWVPETLSTFPLSGGGGCGGEFWFCLRTFAQALSSVQGHIPVHLLPTASHLSGFIPNTHHLPGKAWQEEGPVEQHGHIGK